MKLELPTAYIPRKEETNTRINALNKLFPSLAAAKPNAVLHVPAHKSVIAPING